MSEKHNQSDVHHETDGHDHGSASGKQIFLLALACTIMAFAGAYAFPAWKKHIFAGAAVIAVMPFLWRAIQRAFKADFFTIEGLVAIAVIGALPIGAGEEAVVVVTLFALGELFEGFAAARARSGLGAIAKLLPSDAMIETASGLQKTPVSQIAVGDIMSVTAGERLAADGEIISGASDINEATITGESRPVSKTIGAAVFAGSINGDAVLKVKITKDASGSVVARIGKLVEEAQGSKAPTARFIDRFTRYYMPMAILIAALIAVVPPLMMGASGTHGFTAP